MEKEQTKKYWENLLTTNPWLLWAKKLDTVAHIPNQEPGQHNTYCGSASALLGNNYAPSLPKDAKICPKCLKIIQSKSFINQQKT